MPSKKNKPSRSSTPDRTPGSRSAATPRREQNTANANKEPYRKQLSAASARYPHLISESAVCGIISDTEALHFKGNSGIIWLSQEAMVSSSLLSGSLVSVSLAATGKQNLDEYPLINFVENCIAHLGIEVGDEYLSKIGCHFAIARISPSTKVQKDGVRLSWGLSCTMGFPAIGQALFISPVGDISSCHNLSSGNSSSHLHLHKCKDFSLNLLPVTFHDRLPTNSISKESVQVSHYGKPESPKTPSHYSMHQLGKLHGSSPTVDFKASLDMSSLKLALVDEKMKLLLETCASRWLFGRLLLHGNLVTVPICDSQAWLFSVDSTDDLTRCFSQDLVFEENNNMILNGAQMANSVNMNYAFLCVVPKTKLSISVPVSTAGDNSSERVFPEGHGFGCAIDKETSEITRLGGLFNEVAALEEIVKFSLENMDPLLRYTGVLLHGPPGTGKTTLASCCVRDAGARLFLVNGPEIVSEYYGESEQALKQIFDSARRAAPAVVFIDELDAIAPVRKGGGEALSLRMVATLIQLMDDIKSSDGILVIAATNRPDSIDPALRRPGRLDREIEIGVPSPAQRLDILHTLLNHMDHSLSDTELESLAFATHGFVGADLAALCNEAAMTSLRRLIRFEASERHISESHSKTCAVGKDMQDYIVQKAGKASYHDDLNSLSSLLSELTMLPRPFCSHCFQKIPDSNVECVSCASHGNEQQISVKVTAEDFAVAKMKVRPSAMREVMLELPKVSWEDVGGQRETKKQLIEAIQWPQVHPDAFNRIGIHPPRGLLMIGPPGCSKTLLARAVASEAKLNFLAVKGPELFSKWVGESEKAVRSIFAKARANSPAIIFFDEIDGLVVSRGDENDGTSVADRVLSQLLVEMDGLDQRFGVTVIAATNRPDKIDLALLRPGRFDRILDVQPPDELDREDIFRIHTRSMPCSPCVSIKELASCTEGYTGADIRLVCREAAVAALEENLEISEISMEHFRIGIGRVHPSELVFYQTLAEKFRRFVHGGSALAKRSNF